MRKQHIDAQHSFGIALRLLREKAGLSQEQLAKLTALHRTYVGSVERGERNVSLRNIVALASALGSSASQLLATAERMGEKTVSVGKSRGVLRQTAKDKS